MNKEIEVDDNRILKLTNVLSKTIILNDIDNDIFLKALKDYDDYIKNNNLKTKGPLVMSTNIIGQEEQKLALKLMRQLTFIHGKNYQAFRLGFNVKTFWGIPTGVSFVCE